MVHPLKVAAVIVAFVVATGALVFHPARPLYMKRADVDIVVDDGVTLRGTISRPRWRRGPRPAFVLVHGSGPLTRFHLTGDTRRLVRLGFTVLAYDKRGAGESSGEYMRQSHHPPDVLLGRLARDAAAAFDQLVADPDVDTTRLGLFGASQAGWIIPLAAQLTRTRPRFHVILSGPAVSTEIEGYYSDLSGDGSRPPQVADRAEIERLVLDHRAPPGFDPVPMLGRSQIPTLWLLGGRDMSVPTFASVRVLDSLRAAGAGRHTVIQYPNANHALRDAETGDVMPMWKDMMTWLATR